MVDAGGLGSSYRKARRKAAFEERSDVRGSGESLVDARSALVGGGVVVAAIGAYVTTGVFSPIPGAAVGAGAAVEYADSGAIRSLASALVAPVLGTIVGLWVFGGLSVVGALPPAMVARSGSVFLVVGALPVLVVLSAVGNRVTARLSRDRE